MSEDRERKPSERLRKFLLFFAQSHRVVAELVVLRKQAQSIGDEDPVLFEAKQARIAGEVLQEYQICWGAMWIKPVPWMDKPLQQPIYLEDVAELTPLGRKALGLEVLTGDKPPPSKAEEKYAANQRARRGGGPVPSRSLFEMD